MRREGLEGGSGTERSGRKRAQAARVVQVGARLAFQVGSKTVPVFCVKMQCPSGDAVVVHELLLTEKELENIAKSRKVKEAIQLGLKRAQAVGGLQPSHFASSEFGVSTAFAAQPPTASTSEAGAADAKAQEPSRAAPCFQRGERVVYKGQVCEVEKVNYEDQAYSLQRLDGSCVNVPWESPHITGRAANGSASGGASAAAEQQEERGASAEQQEERGASAEPQEQEERGAATEEAETPKKRVRRRVFATCPSSKSEHDAKRERRTRDHKQLRKALMAERKGDSNIFPPLADEHKPDETALDKVQRIDKYFEELHALCNSKLHTCLNCCERSATQGPSEADQRYCHWCGASPTQRHAKVDLARMLDLQRLDNASNYQHTTPECREEAVKQDEEDREGLLAWQEFLAWMQDRWGDTALSPVEEALVSPVLVMTSVLMLPKGGQLGYRGGVINFVNDVVKIATTLPRRADDCGLVFYSLVDKAGNTRLERVRREVVCQLLLFFKRHNQWMKELNIDEKALQDLPEDGHLPSTFKNVLDPDGGPDTEYASREDDVVDGEAEQEGDDDLTKRCRKVSVNNRGLLLSWLRSDSHLLAGHVRKLLRTRHQLDVQEEDVADQVVHTLLQTPCTETHMSATSVQRLSELLVAGDWLAGLDIRLDEAAEEDGSSLDSLVFRTLLLDELQEVVSRCGVDMPEGELGQPGGGMKQRNVHPKDDIAESLKEVLEGRAEGTQADPVPIPTVDSTAPINEDDKKPQLMAQAFPVLFPLGHGYFMDPRYHCNSPLDHARWRMCVTQHYDGRFARHPRFPYYMLNTHLRKTGLVQANLFMKDEGKKGKHWTVGDLRALDGKGRAAVFANLNKFGSTLRNTPAFWAKMRQQLTAMFDQLGEAC